MRPSIKVNEFLSEFEHIEIGKKKMFSFNSFYLSPGDIVTAKIELAARGFVVDKMSGAFVATRKRRIPNN